MSWPAAGCAHIHLGAHTTPNRAEFDSAGAGSLGEAAYEAAIGAAAVSRIPDSMQAAYSGLDSGAGLAGTSSSSGGGRFALAIAARAMAASAVGEPAPTAAFCAAVSG